MKLALGLAVALLLSACVSAPRLEAGSDIHAFLVSIRDNDRAAFDAHVDREALKANLRARVMAEAARSNAGNGTLQALGAFLAGPLVDVAADAMIRPEVFRAIAEARGYSPARPIPGSYGVAQYVRSLGDGSVCVVLRKNGPCVLDFRSEGGVYRLTGYEGDLAMLRPRA
jgi:hypothetical protein